MTIEAVPVALGRRSYDVHVGVDALSVLPGLLPPGRPVAVVTDANVAALHMDALRAVLAPRRLHAIVLPAGEQTKSWAMLERLVEELLALELTRSDPVVAFGGGVIGDLTGFAASIVKRGIPFVQLPTTLLAMVDSSVGGKTAINAAAGKNLVGAFYQPLAVVADLGLLATLPRREMAAGYAEIVKYGLINDPDFFAWCEANAVPLLAGDAASLAFAVKQSVRAKAAMVAADERETQDVRALLNLGHTFGHALEAETGFSGRLLHGEAVGIGMALAYRFSARQGLCPAADAGRVTAHLDAIGMMARPGQAGIAPDAAPALVAHMLHDKKRTAQSLPFILARGIGLAFVAHDVALADVEAFLAEELAEI